MTVISARSMADLVTRPYRRGAEIVAVPIGADESDGTMFLDYDFAEYKARYGAEPADPRYVLYMEKGGGTDPLTLKIEYTSSSGAGVVEMVIPARTRAGTSFLIPIDQPDDPTIRLEKFNQLPIPLPGTGAENFSVIALLGNIAKLLWVLGREKDSIRWHLNDINQQRNPSIAHGASLDLLGADLRVPRFPPREYSFNEDTTVALYHLNDDVPEGGEVTDVAEKYNALGVAVHNGINIGCESGVEGKFGKGFRIPRDPDAPGYIQIPHSTDLNVTTSSDFTVDAFVKLEPHNGAVGPAAVIVKGTLDAAGALSGKGWSLTTGDFRGFPFNVRWEVRDASNYIITIYADLDLNDGRFHHVAGVIDRAANRVRLFVDGAERAAEIFTSLHSLANTNRVMIGRSNSDHQLYGIVDEVRISKVARIDFPPVLGEGDESYRSRLKIFAGWFLPTPANVLEALNDQLDIAGDPEPLELVEKDRPGAIAERMVRILPGKLAAGKAIDAFGNPRPVEQEVVGTAEDDEGFRDIYLVTCDHSNIDYTENPSEKRMQVSTRTALEYLAERPDVAVGKVHVQKNYDPDDNGLFSVGRALRLSHESMDLESYASEVLAAGFDFVRNDETSIYAAVAPAELLAINMEIDAADNPPEGIDINVGDAVNLTIDPGALPAAGLFKWTLVGCGNGTADFADHPDDAAAPPAIDVSQRPKIRLEAQSPGELFVKVEYTYDRYTVSGAQKLRIGIKELIAGQSIAASGEIDPDETEASGEPEEDFNEIYLVEHSNGISYEPGANTKKMQVSTEAALDALIKLVEAIDNDLSKLRIYTSYNPADTALHGVGRALVFRHADIDAGRLAALAHAAKFDYVKRIDAVNVYASVAAGEKISIREVGAKRLPEEMKVGATYKIEPHSASLPASGSFNWSHEKSDHGEGSFSSAVSLATDFNPTEPGYVIIRAAYLEKDDKTTTPYSFEIKLKKALDVGTTIIPKDKYDIIMNILNYFHPIGTEVITESIRNRVLEVREDLMAAFPGYTYPDFKI